MIFSRRWCRRWRVDRVHLLSRGLFLLVAVAPAAAQSVVDARDVPSFAALFDAEAVAGFRCDARLVPPALNFGLRFQAGYAATFPLAQFRGAGHRIAILARITPENLAPVYLSDGV